MTRHPALIAGPLLALLLAACSGTGTNPTTPSPMASAAVPVPAGPADSTGGATTCSAAIAEFEKVINDDVETGHLVKPVYDKITASLTSPKASCATGKNAQSLAQLATIRSRFGYP